MDYLFVYVFMYNEERMNLFDFCIKKLNEQIKKYNINSKILIHEIGKDKKLDNVFISNNCDFYYFSEYDGIFNRAWGFNHVIKKFNFDKNVKLILIDSDLLVSDDWILNLNRINDKDFTIGWSGIWYLNEKYTNNVLHNNIEIENLDKRNWKEIGIYHKPNINGSSGGITFISSDLFLSVKGIPEYFKDTWGNEDTAFAHKVLKLGYKIKIYQQEVFHLHHNTKTIKDENIKSKWDDIKNWNSKKWKKETEKLGNNWGI